MRKGWLLQNGSWYYFDAEWGIMYYDCMLQMNRKKIEWKRTSYGTIVMETDGKDWYVNQLYSSEQVKKQEKQEKKKR